jgi:hypothetical protein
MRRKRTRYFKMDWVVVARAVQEVSADLLKEAARPQ